MLGRRLATLALYVLLPMQAATSQTTFHVATSGKDGNPGTAQKPFKTIPRAVLAAAAGDTILVHAGPYDEIVEIAKSGAAGQPITLMSAGDGEVVLNPPLPPLDCTATSPTRDRAIQIIDGSDHWVVRGFTIVGGIRVWGKNTQRITPGHIKDRSLPGRGAYDPAGAETTLELLGVDAADFISILDNEITRRGIHTSAARHGLIEGNVVGDIACGAGAAIWINRFSDFWTVRDNRVHDTAPAARHFMSEGIRMGSASSYNLVEENVVEDLGGEGKGIATDVHANWNMIRKNVVRRAYDGLNEQTAGWGNRWLGNRSESNRRYGFAVAARLFALPAPDDDVPAYIVFRNNCSIANLADLRIGAIQASRFRSNAFSVVALADAPRAYWTAAGNTWNGSSAPPEREQPGATCS